MFFLSVPENILVFIAGIGIVQAIFIAFVLIFYSKNDWSVNRFLVYYIFVLTIPMVLPVAQYIYSWQAMILIEPFLTFTGPFLYLYVRSFKETITWKKAWPHFVLFIICIPLALMNYFVVGNKYPVANQVPREAARNILIFIPITIRLIQRIIYYFLSRRVLTSYQRSIRQIFSDTSRIDLKWVRWLIDGFMFLIIVTLVFYPLMINIPQYFSLWVLIPGVIVSLYIYMAVIKGISQPALWHVQPGLDKEKTETVIDEAEKMESEYAINDTLKTRKTGLSDTKISEIAEKVIYQMESEKIYQEPDLTLQQLAAKLQLSVHHLSQAINIGLKRNFYDLINNYRVEEAKRLLLDTKSINYTILSVGFEAGFNSKTTFNTVFKKFTGMTPTEFRDKEKAALSAA